MAVDNKFEAAKNETRPISENLRESGSIKAMENADMSKPLSPQTTPTVGVSTQRGLG